MASAVQSMRLCLRAARRRAAAPPAPVAPRQLLTIRSFSSTSIQRQPKANNDNEDGEEDEEDDMDGFEDEEYQAELQRALAELEKDSGFEKARRLQDRAITSMGSIFTEAMRTRKPRDEDFWTSEESDTDLMIDEGNTEKFEEDDIMSIGHAKFEEFREYREYARVAAWQMPLLSKLATPFEVPTAEEPLRFRYTSYMGEFHPAEKKVVLEFCPKDMPLDEAQQQKLRKLLGPRWNPETDIAKMSCEQFEHQAQNKRYLGDLVNKLVAQAADPTDMFEDVPLDTRHHTFKVKPKFPVEWRLTDERRESLADTRQKILLLDQAKEKQGTLVDGVEVVNAIGKEKEAGKQPVMASVRTVQNAGGSGPFRSALLRR
ncbi:mitochondrial ribosomal subunit protein-domain-containing protein [Xylaria nigripes]|nr:mitochondrial ribosomal subunit protein-domain-containing protein [Xylaria nigripes]